jgi:hypothetical protein
MKYDKIRTALVSSVAKSASAVTWESVKYTFPVEIYFYDVEDAIIRVMNNEK